MARIGTGLLVAATALLDGSQAFSPGSSLPTSRHGLDALTCSGFGRPLVARGRVGVGSLRAGPEGDGDEKSKAAAEEAAKWKEMASKMADQRKEVKDGPSPVKDVELTDMNALEGSKLPEVSTGELDSLMARAEAFKAKQQAAAAAQAAKMNGGQVKQVVDELPRRWQSADMVNKNKKKLTPAAPLVGGDAGSMRQAAPYTPGESKAGAVQEGWTEDQLESILAEEAKWKQKLEEKKAEEAMANDLAQKAENMFAISDKMRAEKGVPSTMESAVVQALLSSVEVMQRGCGRFRIDVDVSKDMTYTTLKNSIPFTRVFTRGLNVNGFSNLRIIMPDPGAAMLAKRDWAGEDGHNVVAFERFGDTPISEDDGAIVVVAPAAPEIEKIRKIADDAAEKGIPLILINPSVKSPGGENLGNLGAYSLGLSAFLGTFETAYHLTNIPFGILHRQYPQGFGIYEEVPTGFSKLQEVKSVPSGQQLEEIYQAAHPEAKSEGFEGLAKGVGRFIRNYSKG